MPGDAAVKRPNNILLAAPRVRPTAPILFLAAQGAGPALRQDQVALRPEMVVLRVRRQRDATLFSPRLGHVARQ